MFVGTLYCIALSLIYLNPDYRKGSPITEQILLCDLVDEPERNTEAELIER
jgi:hypothetical protein